MKKLLSLTLLLFVFGLISCNKKENKWGKTKLTVQGRLYIPAQVFTLQEQIKMSTRSFQQILKINEHTLVQFFAVKGFSIVLSNGKEIRPDPVHGDLYLEEEDFQWMNDEIVLYIKDKKINKSEYRYLADQKILLFEAKIQDYLTKREHCHGEQAKENQAMGRCMDYNGWQTDGVNYPKSDWRSYRNFVGSDCNFALLQGYCYLDHYNGGCYANHGGISCSALIGHSSSYHTH